MGSDCILVFIFLFRLGAKPRFYSSGVRVYFLLINCTNIAILLHLFIKCGTENIIVLTRRYVTLFCKTTNDHKAISRFRMRFSPKNRETIVFIGSNYL